MPPTRKSQFRVYLHAEQDSVVYPMPFLTRDSRVKDLFKAAELATGLSMEWQNIYYIDQCTVHLHSPRSDLFPSVGDLNPDHQLRDFHVVHRSHFTTHIPDELAKLLMDVRDGDWRKIVNHGISPYLPTGNGWIVEPVNWQRTRSRLNFAWMSAARFGLHQIGAALLSLGANLNVTTHYGRTALHMAAAHGHIGVLQLLAQKGANLRVTDCDGVTPLAIARKHGHMAFARSLNRLDWLVRVRGVQPRFLNLPLKAFQLCDSKYPKWRQDPDGKLYLEESSMFCAATPMERSMHF
ncbi:unnamed protein product [Echinostoma caproni]|uniref:ANK_REP_REGION domain-containing protein n=1 Tax=Echinostoma caproni TaxID=27848 RepID=A0A183ACA8_9TREM|nr:unnamed protein product [Echinostoma caproni]